MKGKNMFIAKGFESTCEINGQVADPTIVYMGHCSFSGVQTIEVIVQSLLRKLFEKSGHVVTGLKQLMQYYTYASAVGWRLELEMKDLSTGTIVKDPYNLALSDTIYSITGDVSIALAPLWTNLIPYFVNYATGAVNGSLTNTQVPHRLVLYRDQLALGTSWAFDCALNLADEYLHLRSQSDLKVQNRSVDANSSTSTETVSANPIQGKLYHFNSGVPKTRVNGIEGLLAAFDLGYGCYSARGAQFPAEADGFRDPPDGRFFWNCKKVSTVRLDPGAIKLDVIKYSTSGKLLSVLKRLLISSGTSASASKMVTLAGSGSMICFEDVINVSSAANITIAYEINRKFGAYCVTKCVPAATGTLYQLTYNNVPP